MSLLDDRDDYRSPESRPSWFSRAFPSLRFYPKLLGIVWRASKSSRRGTYDDDAWIRSSLEVVRLLESLGARFVIENTSAYRGLDAPCVFIGNHMSTLETFTLPSIVHAHRRIIFVLKRSLTTMPVFGHVASARDPIVVDRVNPKEDFKAVVEGGVERLKRGQSVVVFPQTTRSLRLDPASFNSIGVKLAKRARVPIVPIALKTDCWGLGKWVKDFGRIRSERTIRFCFGDPLEVEGNGRKTHQHIVDFISGKLETWFA
jgi:1-acyl-sn-glycerol-3-phosphate acyltransferase